MTEPVQRLFKEMPDLKPIYMQWRDDEVTVTFDPTCAGTIEREWPRLHQLVADCGCEPHFEWIDTMTTRTKLEGPSGNPTFVVEHQQHIALVLKRVPAQAQKEVA